MPFKSSPSSFVHIRPGHATFLLHLPHHHCPSLPSALQLLGKTIPRFLSHDWVDSGTNSPPQTPSESDLHSPDSDLKAYKGTACSVQGHSRESSFLTGSLLLLSSPHLSTLQSQVPESLSVLSLPVGEPEIRQGSHQHLMTIVMTWVTGNQCDWCFLYSLTFALPQCL